MTLYQFYLAGKSIANLLKLSLPYRTMRRVIWLKNKIAQECELYSQEETKLIDQFCQKDERGRPLIKNNRVSFDSKEAMELFSKEIEKLRLTDIEYDIAPVVILEEEMANQAITGEDIENLSMFIIFRGGD